MATEWAAAVADVLNEIRRSDGVTQVQLAERLGLGRSYVAQRVDELNEAGLVQFGSVAGSSGGRARRLVRLRKDAGLIVSVDVHLAYFEVALADLDGNFVERATVDQNVVAGADVVMREVERVIDGLLLPYHYSSKPWAMCISLPAPVDFATGLPLNSPAMPGWDGHDVTSRLSNRYGVPVLVDNDVNLMALGELRCRPADSVQTMLFLQFGAGISAGLITGGALHRGADGCAGDIGHVFVAEAADTVCRCGSLGCLDAVAGGGALAAQAKQLAASGLSPSLAEVWERAGEVSVEALASAARRGDSAARVLLAQAGRVVGVTLSTLVSFYNPEAVVVGGPIIDSGDFVLAALRESVYGRSRPLATKRIRIEPSRAGAEAALIGATQLALDAAFTWQQLEQRMHPAAVAS